MIITLVFLLLVVVLTYISTILKQSPSTVSFVINKDLLWVDAGTYQMELWFFLLSLATIIVFSIVVFKLLTVLLGLPSIGKRFGKNRRDLKTAHLLQKGMLAMGKGQWKRAENILAKGARLSYKSKQDTGLLLTAAAQAAQQLGANTRRDQYLLEARQLAVEGENTFSAALAEAQLHIDLNEAEQALAVLEPHQTNNYNNPRLQALQSAAYEQVGEYGKVWDLLKNQRKNFNNKVLYQERQLEVAKALFENVQSPLERVEQVWSELPKAEKKQDVIILSYVSALINANELDRAEGVLAKAINTQSSDLLVHAYTQLETGSSRTRLNKVTAWVRKNPENAYLNYAAAKLAFQCEQFEKAKEYAERSIKVQPLAESLALLGKIYEMLGQENNALQAYRTSLGMTYLEEKPVLSGEVLSAPENVQKLTREAELKSTSGDVKASVDN